MAKHEDSRSASPRRKFSLTYHLREDSLDRLSKKCSSLLRYGNEPRMQFRDNVWVHRDDVIYFALEKRPHMKADDVITVLERPRRDGSFRFECMRDGDGVWARALEKRKRCRRTPSEPRHSETPRSLLNQPVQLQPEPLPKQSTSSAWLDQRPPAVPHGGQQPVPSAWQGPVPAYHTPTPAMQIDRLPLAARFKTGDAVKIIHCGIPGCIACCGVLGQPLPDVHPGLWTVHMDGGKIVCCDLSQLQLCSDPLQADGGAGTAGSGPRSSQQRVPQSVKLIAPTGKIRHLHLLVQTTVQDILKNHLPSEMRGQNNVAIFNMSGEKIEPSLTVGDLGEESEQVVLQFQTDDW